MNIVARLKELVGEERKIAAEIIRLLLRVEDEKIYAKLGYPSIYEFCRRELGYSEGAAYRRISTMHLHRRDDRCAEKIESEELSLSNAAKVETTLRQAEKQGAEVHGLFEAVLNSSSREAEKIIELILPEQARAKLPTSLEEKIGKLRALLANNLQGSTNEEIIHLALDEAIEARVPKQGDLAAEVKSPEKRHVPDKLKNAILHRDRHRCTYTGKNGHRCEATEFLEIDHIKPLAHGGKTTAENLRALCRTHNQLEAERHGLAR